MLNKLKKNIFGNNNKLMLQNTLTQLQSTRKNHTTLILYGSPTEGNWLGIANATKNLYPTNAIEIPQWFSNPVFNTQESKLVYEAIIKLQFEKVIISGFAPYFFNWIDILTKHTTIEILYHGTISEFHDKDTQKFISQLIQFSKQQKIKRLGFIKKDMAEIFAKLYGFNCFHQKLNKPTISKNIKKLELDKNKFHIGVFGADTFNKNIHNQVIHALMFENTMIHVLDKSIFAYLDKNDRIIGYEKDLTRDVFLNLLGSMDLNLYMSYNESWGLIAYESEALGVCCLRTTDIDYFEIIKAKIHSK